MKQNVVAIILGALVCIATAPILASPLLFADNPVRPNDSSRLEATEGLVIGYKLYLTNDLLSPRLTVYDELSKKVRTFSLSFRTKLNGTVMQCHDFRDLSLSNPKDASLWLVKQVAKQNHLCKHLPSEIIRGKTRLVLLYWRYNYTSATKRTGGIYNSLDQNPRSDAIWIVPARPVRQTHP